MNETPPFPVRQTSAPVTQASPIPPPEYGVKLRHRRESYNLTIEDISSRLRIRRVYLEAFEKGTVSDYPADVYVKGFLRSYARYVNLNADEIIFLYQRHAQQLNKKEEGPVKRRRMLSPSEIGVAATMALLIGGAGFWGWRIMQDSATPPDRPAIIATESPVVNHPDVLIHEITPVEPFSLPQNTDGDAPVTGAPDPQNEETTIEFAENTDRLLRSLPTGTIIIGATGDTWVEIRDPEGIVVLSRILGNRETYIVPQQGRFFLTSGDAGRTVIHYGTGIWNILGEEGVVLRNVSLQHNELVARFAN